MKEFKIYGLSACLKFAEKKPEKVVRAFFSQEVARKFGKLMKLLAKNKKVYRIVTLEELVKISESQHHEGVCFVAEPPKVVKLDQWKVPNQKNCTLLYLDGVSNPHNLGAIARVASHFGVDAIIQKNMKKFFSGASHRTAEGGAESLSFLDCESLDQLNQFLKTHHFTAFSTSSHLGKNLYETRFPKKTILILGDEKLGVSPDYIEKFENIKIPGTGHVESLNVATATAVLLSELWRQKTV